MVSDSMNHFSLISSGYSLFLKQEVNQDDTQASDLLFDKHVDYVVNHGNDKNDFVSFSFAFHQLT